MIVFTLLCRILLLLQITVSESGRSYKYKLCIYTYREVFSTMVRLVGILCTTNTLLARGGDCELGTGYLLLLN